MCCEVFLLPYELLTIATEVVRDSGIAKLCKGKSRELSDSKNEIEKMCILLRLEDVLPFPSVKTMLSGGPNAGNSL